MQIDLDQACEIVTSGPSCRTASMALRTAVRLVVHHHPLAACVEVLLADGRILCEEEIEAIYALSAMAAGTDGVELFRSD